MSLLKMLGVWIKEDKIAAVSTILCFIAITLISFMYIEGVILIAISEFGWIIVGLQKDIKFLVIQNFVLLFIEVIGIYYWIASERGTWILMEVLKWI
jgi:hypothetical protein